MTGNEQQQKTTADDGTNLGDGIADLQPSQDEATDVKGGGLVVGTWHSSGGGGAGKGQ
ncbi:hypothetical protein [Mycolicibacterium sp. CBMA 226]|uniref:hypothetical protein n=1 Tax=Mycolicibacterium sp. CBMA 226 TaxID=2606611 RepID=UPI0012DC8D86|nr:hypothetical protein [Mycolicibacterium sp. CBMA 226]